MPSDFSSFKKLMQPISATVWTIAMISSRQCVAYSLFLWGFWGSVIPIGHTQADETNKLVLFEEKIRPALHEHCLGCHHVGKKSGGLALDSREGWQVGGDSGPAIVPGKGAESLLFKTVSHLEPGLEMPAKAPQLDRELIKQFQRWIDEGAVDPRDQPEPLVEGGVDWENVFQERMKWWCWQPNMFLGKKKNYLGIDHWIDQRMMEAGITPAPLAEPGNLVRRLSFQLRGLPPAITDIENFRQLPNDQSWNDLVEAYLQSNEFAEHWARHWMDTVRYSETHGSEDDAYLPFAYRYRDYLIRAFKQDLPIDRLIEEHIAGDLIEPRWSDNGINESLVGLAFWRFIEFNQTPVDVKKEEIVVVDSQIDALGKAFQGMTISCARCHDHKFDPISDEDYYAIYGVLSSTRSGMRVLDRPEIFSAQNARLAELQKNFTQAWCGHYLEEFHSLQNRLLEAIVWLRENVQSDSKWSDIEKSLANENYVIQAFARLRHGNVTSLIKDLVSNLVDTPDDRFEESWKLWQSQAASAPALHSKKASVLFDLSSGDLSGWRVDGAGLSKNVDPMAIHWSVSGGQENCFTSLLSEGFHSNRLSDKHAGVLRSPDFVIESDSISLLCRGTGGARARLVIENFQGDSLLFDTINPTLNADNLGWVTMTIRPQWKGLRAHLEFLSRDAKPYIGVTKDPSYLERSNGRSSFGIWKVVAHDRGVGLPELPVIPSALFEIPVQSRVEAVQLLMESLSQSLARLRDNQATAVDIRWLNCWIGCGFMSTKPTDLAETKVLVDEYRRLEEQIPKPRWSPGVYEDRLPVKQAWLPRGDHKNPGQEIQRGYLQAVKDVSQPIPDDESGRLQLARSISSPRNPLTARVYVNRVWTWLFGEGLVRSVDNFGRMGEVPSHSELLDELAAQFIEEGWSTKKLIRRMVSSTAWRRSTAPTDSAVAKDADNRLWSHMLVRRIDAESIRDSMLLVAGNLKRPDAGLGTLNYYRAVMEPNKQSPPGPLDGDGRRSIYLEVRRNFPYDFLLSFDFPRPASPVGKRSTTIVPTQSLTLLNDPFVLHQSKLWAKRIQESAGNRSEKIGLMYQELLGRRPKPSELETAERLWEQVERTEGVDAAWQLLAHGMFNLKEFIFVR